MPATVYYADMHCRSHQDSKIAKVARLCEALNLKKIIKKKGSSSFDVELTDLNQFG